MKAHYCMIVLALAGCTGAANGPDSRGTSVGAAEYCEGFARTYSAGSELTYMEGTARVKRRSHLLVSMSNLFSPSHSRFTAAFECRFEATPVEGGISELSVDMLLANTRAFAEHTQWDKLQSIPIGFVVDEATGRSGYGIFKYLERR